MQVEVQAQLQSEVEVRLQLEVEVAMAPMGTAMEEVDMAPMEEVVMAPMDMAIVENKEVDLEKEIAIVPVKLNGNNLKFKLHQL